MTQVRLQQEGGDILPEGIEDFLCNANPLTPLVTQICTAPKGLVIIKPALDMYAAKPWLGIFLRSCFALL